MDIPKIIGKYAKSVVMGLTEAQAGIGTIAVALIIIGLALS